MALIKPWLQFKFGGREKYTPSALSVMPTDKLEKEYTRLRKAAKGRLKTIGKSEFKEGDIYREYKNKFDLTAKQILRMGGKRLLQYRLSSLQRFLAMKESSITGLRETRDSILETLHEHGYDFINATNISDFGRFMDTVKSAAELMRYDSERVAELYHYGQKNKIPTQVLIRDFYDYMENKT